MFHKSHPDSVLRFTWGPRSLKSDARLCSQCKTNVLTDCRMDTLCSACTQPDAHCPVELVEAVSETSPNWTLVDASERCNGQNAELWRCRRCQYAIAVTRFAPGSRVWYEFQLRTRKAHQSYDCESLSSGRITIS